MRIIRAALSAFFAMTTAAASFSQSVTLDWSTVDGGGGTCSGGLFEVIATIGEPDAGRMSGGRFEVSGGFLPGGAVIPCPGDLNGDRQVELADLTVLLAHFGTPSGATLADGDLDGNGAIDLSDLTILLGHFGSTCS